MKIPVAREFRTEEELHAAFIELRTYTLRSAKLINDKYQVKGLGGVPNFGPRPLLLACRADDYQRVNWISDWYNHRARLSARRYDEKTSPAEAWPDLADHLSLRELTDRRRASDCLYEKVRGCGNFRPLVYRFLIDYFGATRVYDPCAGWGCRLLAAMAAGVEYLGVDCNPEVHPGYQEAIWDWWLPHYPKPVLKLARFQDIKLRPGRYDLVATSPPYYDLEVYPGSETPTDEVAWTRDFLGGLIDSAHLALRDQGVCVLIINGRAGTSYLQTLPKLAASRGFTFLGVISYADLGPRSVPRNPQPMWVFRKGGVGAPLPTPIPWWTVKVQPSADIDTALANIGLRRGDVPARVRVTSDSGEIACLIGQVTTAPPDVWVFRLGR